jgi:hypothetical protein
MRSDMPKVVTEPSRRRGWGFGPTRTARRLTKDEFDKDDHGATRIGHRNDKDSGILLGPIRRYLRKQLGRPWDDVYSDICTVFDKRMDTTRRVLRDILYLVETHTFLLNGRVYAQPVYGWNLVRGFYVHPVSGLLCWSSESRTRWPSDPKPVDTIELDKTHTLSRTNGIWYLLTYTLKRERIYPLMKHADGTIDEHFKYHDWIALDHKRQLSRKELLTYGLSNTPDPPALSRRELAALRKTRQRA